MPKKYKQTMPRDRRLEDDAPSFAEIGKKLGIPAKTASQLYRRAIRKLRARIKSS